MKYSVMVLIVTALVFNIAGTKFYPNIKLNFEKLSQNLYIDYSIEIIDGCYTPFFEIASKEVILRGTTTRDANGKTCNIWCDVIMTQTKNVYCGDIYNSFGFERNEIFTKSIINENDAEEGSKLEVLDVFYYNFSLMFFSEFDGCQNALKNDKISQIEVHLILFKNCEAYELNIFGKTYSVYSTMLGYIRFMNTATEENTIEQNEVVINDIIEYCQKVAKFANNSYIPTFDHIYLEDIFKPPRNTWDPWSNYIVCLSIFLTMIILLIIIKYCFNYLN